MKNKCSTGELTRLKFPIRMVVCSVSWTSQRRMNVSRAMASKVDSFEFGLLSRLGMRELGLGMMI